jgi:putative ABC transport system permease protein
MLKNNLLITWRNLLRYKTNSFINIAGLAIGIACVLLITLYVRDELQYDHFLKNANRIYQVDMDAMMGGQGGLLSNTPPTVGPALQKSFPEIEAFTRFYVMGNEVVSNEAGSQTQNHYTEKKFLAVDSNFLQVFDFGLKEGDPKTCLRKPHSIVLTETTAKKYFGNTSAIGQNLTLDEYNEPFEVTAIVKDLPAQSTIQFDLLIPVTACPPVLHFSWSWVWLQVNTYVLLKNNTDRDPESIKRLVSKFPSMVRVQAASAFKRIGQPFDEFIRKGNKWDFFLQPLLEVHLYSANIGSQFLFTLGDIKYVYIFSAIALFIIILACVNFMNLSTAQSSIRAKEVGIRKVLGSEKNQLVKQFLTEAIVYSTISTIFALLLVALLLPAFNSVAAKSLEFSSIFHSWIWLFVLLLTFLTGLLAGSYPAFYLTSFNPVSVLKGGFFKKSFSNILIRNGLVVFQFTISISLIVCTIILFQQLNYSQTKDLGLRKDNVIVIPNGEKMGSSPEKTFRLAAMDIPGVLFSSITTSVPTLKSFGDNYVPEPGSASESPAKDILLNSFMVDEAFIPALNIQVLKGRNFSREYKDSASVILNETAASQIGWKDPIGRYMVYTGNNDQRFKVIGIVKDFDEGSIRYAHTAFALFHASSNTYQMGTSYIIVKAESKDSKAILGQLEDKWKKLAPGVPFEYTFLDKNFEALYNDEEHMGTVFGIFTALSILVACLGLFGLSIFTAERRKKEIGVRKVLGASVRSLLQLLTLEFFKLICIAAIIAFPIAWWSMKNWLDGFAYRIQISWWVFVLAGILSAIIAIATISFQSVKAALGNPVKSLRTE